MAADEKWYFTKEELSNTHSIKCGYDVDRELSCRQQAAHLIQDMGQRLQVSQLCINTAIVYMHRFYVFHSFSQFHLDAMAAAALFLAAKVEEMPRKLEHVIRVKQICYHRDQSALDVKSEQYLEQAQDLVFNENVLLQTLGFDVAIDHPHTHVVRCCHLVRASKDLAQTSYFMASNSLHLTTMCLQYKPTVVACFCIHLACKWSNWEIPQSNEGKYWFYYVDKTVTQDLLEQLTEEFLVIFEKCPSRLKKKIKSANSANSSYQFDPTTRSQRDSMHEGVSFQSHHRPQDPNKPSSSQLPASSSQRADSREHQEKRERERQMPPQGAHSQHRDGHHRSHHTGHPHPLSASSSALMKPHSGIPMHGKAPHPAQHRSSMSHHSRPDHHVRPDHPQRPDHPSRPDHPARPDHQQRADYQQRQDRQPRPEHATRPEHHPRSDQQVRPDQARQDHHLNRPDHPQRSDHQNRADHQQRADHHIRTDHQSRPEHQGRSDHILRSDHPGNQARADHQQRLDPAGRQDQANRQDHANRLEHQVGLDRHERLDAAERHAHSEPRFSAVTASRDQLRREAALQREASRRDIMLNLPSSLMMHSPAQRTASGDSAISSSSSISLISTSQDVSNIGVPSNVFAGPSSSTALKHPGSSDQSHRHSVGYEKPKPTSLAVESHSRHRLSLQGADRRPTSSSVSLDRKMMQEISERRQLESFFGKSEAQERMNEKHQVKHTPSAPFKDIKKELDTIQQQPQSALVPSSVPIKKEKVSPSRQPFAPTAVGRMDVHAAFSSVPQRPNYPKSTFTDYSLGKVFKSEPDGEPFSETRNGTSVPTLLTPKVEKVEPDIKEEIPLMSTKVPPVKSSIFSPEKTMPKERESLILPQRAVKTMCPPSPGIAFGSPPIAAAKSQGLNNRNRAGNDGETAMDLYKMERETTYDNLVRDNRNELKNPHLTENSSMIVPKSVDSRVPPSLPKMESKHSHQLLNKPGYPVDHKFPLYPPSSANSAVPGGRSVLDERQPVTISEVTLNQAPTLIDSRPAAPVKTADVRTALPIVSMEGDLGAVAFPASETKDLASAPPSEEGSLADHHHHKSKKKKEKKEKHKHKDKEKHREEKKHKSKHKEKDKERRKAEAAMPEVLPPSQSKITLKIPKEKITPAPAPAPVASASGGLKLKINLSQLSSTPSSSSKESRKRERERSSPGHEGSHPKTPKLNVLVDTPKRNVGSVGHSSSSRSSYDRQNGLESRGGNRHMQHPQHYSGSKMVMDDGSSLKPSEISKNSSSTS